MYIAEVSPAKWRGRLVGFFQFNVVSGILLAYLSNYLLDGFRWVASNGAGSWAWRLPRPAVPGDAVRHSAQPALAGAEARVAEARQALATIGAENVESELAEIVAPSTPNTGMTASACFRAQVRLPILLAVSLAMFNQLSGINAILYYLNDIFARRRFQQSCRATCRRWRSAPPSLLFTVIAMSVIDRIGRKLLLLVGAVAYGRLPGGVSYIFSTRATNRCCYGCW